jgi:hypothetical protein
VQKIRLKAIWFDVDFRYNELSIFNKYKKRKDFPGDLGKDEAYLFVSKSGNQLLWIINNLTSIEQKNGLVRDIIDTRRWRMVKGTWHPWMLSEYAKAVGVELAGIRKFNDYFVE